jgi:hypothetical protein
MQQCSRHGEVATASCGRTGGAANVARLCAPIAATLADELELLEVAAAR